MAAAMHPIRLGFDCCYLIQDRGTVLIDGGFPGRAGDFRSALDRLGVRPEDICLMVMTHGHFDHVGCAREIRDLTGASIAMHQPDAGWLENAVYPPIRGVTAWGRVTAKPLNWPLAATRFEPTKVDLVLPDEDWPLHPYGIHGRVLWTPGHTAGSVSVLLETGEAFVGDLAMNRFPLRLAPGLPIFAEDMNQVVASWRKLIDAGARVVYPAHGKPFSSEIICRLLERRGAAARGDNRRMGA